ncbi:MAG TPA: hypothetical protein DCG19_03915 [Cryomorphaceae bacterium]|nr:hypothetical protein [Owenweeksia sp.]MBG00397.1 hypothetical protein [Owenweeksia sp.]HAD96526.1 hypothetical protein [Cryomorphaceae bacterium]HBF21363.1 hypothetical protein [Cryomorphaceae bacterium]
MVCGQRELIDSLKTALKKTDNLAEKSRLATDIAWESLYINPNHTLAYARTGLKYAQKANYPFGEATAYGTMGLYYDVVGDYNQAIESYLEAIRVLEKMDSVEVNLASNYSNLALIFDYIQDYEKAVFYTKKALKFEIISGQKDGEIISYINLAAMYRSLGMEDSSLYYHDRAIVSGKAAGLDSYKVTYVNVGNIYMDRGELDTAEYYYRLFLDYARKQGYDQRNFLAYAYSGMAELHLMRGELEKGKAYADSSMELTIQMKFRDLRKEIYNHYSDYYEKKGNYKQALVYMRKMTNLKDSLGNAEIKKQIETLEARFQNEQNRNHIKELQTENEIKELTLAKAHTQRKLFLVIAILALLTLAIVIAFWITARKTSRQLKAKNTLIENLIRESHHRIKNNLQVVSSLLHMQGLTLKSKEAQKAIDDAHSRVKAIALLHQRLQGSSDFELIRLNLFLKELCENVLKSMSDKPENIELSLEVGDIRTPTDKAISIGLLTNEFFTNSLKYAWRQEEKLRVRICISEGDEMKITYQDNGPGLPEDLEIGQSPSLGFTIINSLISQLNGTLKILTPPGFGAEISLPDEH